MSDNSGPGSGAAGPPDDEPDSDPGQANQEPSNPSRANQGPSDPGQANLGSGGSPFHGTPFEALFAAFGGAMGGGGNPGNPGSPGGADFPWAMGGSMPDFAAMMQQVQALMQPHDGPVNWQVATDMARKAVAANGPDPSPSSRQSDALADAVRLADHWLDETTDFASGVTSTAVWSRAEWIEHTMNAWKVLVEPIAQSAVGALSTAMPEQAREMVGPIMELLSKATGAMVAAQVGSGVGALAGGVLGASDIGLPLGPDGKAALLPSNVVEFTRDLDVPEDDVLLYLALREAAHQRLFAHVPWLRDHLMGAVTDYARGITIDISGMEHKLQGFNPMDPNAMQEALAGGVFDLERSPAQKAALERLEVTLALVEGWVDDVVGQATAERMPTADKLREAVRRRRAAGGPAEQAFAALVGLELRPRRLREASTLWGSLRTRQGTEGRDGVWMSPHLLPTAADLDDPLTFREDAVAVSELSDQDFEAGLRKLMEGGPEGRPRQTPGE